MTTVPRIRATAPGARRRARMLVGVLGAAVGIGLLGAGAAFAYFEFTDASNAHVADAMAGAVGAGQAPGLVGVSGRDVTISWTAASNATTYTAARANVAPQSLASTLHGTCATNVSGTSCTDTSVPESGTEATDWTYQDTPKRDNWVGSQSPASAQITVPGPSLDLGSTTFTADGGSTSATVDHFFDSEGVTYCVDQSAACSAGNTLGTADVPSSGGTVTTPSILIPSGLSVGTHTVYAIGSGGSLPSVTISIGPGAATQLSFTVQPATGQDIQATGSGTFGVSVAVEDAHGNVETGDSATAVTLAINHNAGPGGVLSCADTGGLTVDAAGGVATFTGCAITAAGTGYTLTATSAPTHTAPADADAFNITAGTATKLAFTNATFTNVTEGAALSPQPQVSVEDANGNLVTTDTGNVTLSIGSYTAGNGGTTKGSLSCTADPIPASGGVASFAGCQITGTAGAGTYTLGASHSGPLSGASGNLGIVPGSASQLVFANAAFTNVTEATALSPQPQVSVEDANGNVEVGDTGNVTLSIGSYSAGNGGTTKGSLTCTANPIPANAGVATFAGCQITGTAGAGTYALGASHSGPVSGTSGNLVIVAGAASKLAFTAQPTNTTAGMTITPAVGVSVEDSSGNLETTDNTTSVTVAIGANPGSGTLSGTLTHPVSGGMASFGNLSINNAGTGYTLTATSSPAHGTATSSTFNILATGTQSLVIANGTGTAGKPDSGDTITLTFGAALRVSTLCSAWSGDTSSHSLTNMTVTFTKNSGGTDSAAFAVPTASCTGGGTWGSLSLNTHYVSGGTGSTLVFGSSTVAYAYNSATGQSTLTVTLGTVSSGSATTVTSSATGTWSESGILNTSGSALVPTSASETAELF